MTRRRDLLAGSAVCFLATLLFRGWGLGRPPVLIFDEVYYANDALDLVTHGVERLFAGHPPFAKWLIALGYLSGTFSPFTWRLASLVAGSIVVALVFAIAFRLSGSVIASGVAAFLALTDGIAYVTGRLALLDGFLALSTSALLAFLVFTAGRTLQRRHVIALGLLAGAALATKWSSAPALVVTAVVVFTRARADRTFWRAIGAAAAVAGLALVVYVATYGGFLIGGSKTETCAQRACLTSYSTRVAALPRIQWKMLQSELELKRRHVLTAPGWRWVAQDRATSLFAEECYGAYDGVCRPGGPSFVQVVARGDPLLWAACLPIFAGWYVARRRGRPVTPGLGFVMIWGLALWLQFVVFSKTYTFYASPIVPPLAIATVLAARDVIPVRVRPVVLLGAISSAAVVFGFTHAGQPWMV